MRTAFIAFCIFIISGFAGCSPSDRSSFQPSIANLSPNETLRMNYRACHSGCTKGRINFQGTYAAFREHRLELTEDEISTLDELFLLGKSKSEASFCSLRIEISFKQSRGLRTIHAQKPLTYPCHFGLLDKQITPGGLVYYLTERPDEIPIWRLSPKERNKTLNVPLKD